MTLALSSASQWLIVMTVDSAITREFGDRREYDIQPKSFPFDGIGVVATWGELAGNTIYTHLMRAGVKPGTHTVEDLAELVNEYLRNVYRPDEIGLSDVGYHVAGFDRRKRPRLFHVFWGPDQPPPPGPPSPGYKKYDHSPAMGKIQFLYNGRNDLADLLVRTMLNQAATGRALRYDIQDKVGLIQFSEFTARFAGELTPEVGPPFQRT